MSPKLWIFVEQELQVPGTSSPPTITSPGGSPAVGRNFMDRRARFSTRRRRHCAGQWRRRRGPLGACGPPPTGEQGQRRPARHDAAAADTRPAPAPAPRPGQPHRGRHTGTGSSCQFGHILPRQVRGNRLVRPRMASCVSCCSNCIGPLSSCGIARANFGVRLRKRCPGSGQPEEMAAPSFP